MKSCDSSYLIHTLLENMTHKLYIYNIDYKMNFEIQNMYMKIKDGYYKFRRFY